jgi:Ca2+-binding RTX toxin-like protein
MDAGGYQMALTSGTYDVSFSLGGNLLGSTQTVTIGSTNVKVDLNTDAIISNSDFNNAAVVDGTNSSDDLLGDDSNQLLRGFNGSDRLYGGDGNDTVVGHNNDDIAIGGSGDDYSIGGDGNDILIGVNPVKENPGYGEFDILRGDAGHDIFVLGDGDGVYYNHQGTRAEGNVDLGVIADFNASEDIIQLYGNAGDYELLTVNGRTQILYKTPGTKELIGIVNNASGLNLNDSGFTYVDNDSLIIGNASDNALYGGDTNQKLLGGHGNDTIKGGAGDDIVRGGTGNDILIGGKGDDIVLGEEGNDILIGVNPLQTNPGYGELDRLRGDVGNDIFVLGDENLVFYNHQGTKAEGLNDKAVIFSFNSGEDIIQLHGSAGEYSINTANSSTQIFYNNSGTQELVGVVAGVSELDLNGTEFSYV